jgi:hypothetical protein
VRKNFEVMATVQFLDRPYTKRGKEGADYQILGPLKGHRYRMPKITHPVSNSSRDKAERVEVFRFLELLKTLFVLVGSLKPYLQ